MQHYLTKSNSNQTVSLSKGDTFTIELDETPTTGYIWEVDNIGSGVVQLQSNTYTLSPEAAIGGGGKRKITFLVNGTGKSSLRLKNWRRWSGEVVETFQIYLQAV
jgi:predicted secreted protein